jgi:hypothetical protein
MSSGPLDLLALDRDVARANEALVRFRATPRLDSDRASETDPLAPFRHVAGQKAYDALASHGASGLEASLRDALLLWVYALTQARIGCDLEVAWEREATASQARVLLEVPRQTSYREAWREAVWARDLAARQLWVDAAASTGPGLAAIARESATRRLEVASRLGLAHPSASVSRFLPGALREAAWGLVRGASDLLGALRHESGVRAPRRLAGPIAMWIEDGLALDASEGWPARLSNRWLEDSFREMSRGLTLTLKLPRVAGAASFSRALSLFGQALRENQRSALPFSIARDPFHLDGHRFGFAFGLLPTKRLFHRKVLGLSERQAHLQARALARTALQEAVWVAARWLLTDEAHYAPVELWEEIADIIFGGPIDGSFRGAWPSPRGDEASRLEALLTDPDLTNLLVARFDEDWFRNPEAVRWIRARATGPAREPLGSQLADPRVAASLVVGAFEEALG